MQITKNGNYTFTVTGLLKGKNITSSQSININQFNNIPRLTIGTKVSYGTQEMAERTFDIEAKYACSSTFDSEYSAGSVTLNDPQNSNASMNISKWKVFRINENNIQLIPASFPIGWVRLQGAPRL